MNMNPLGRLSVPSPGTPVPLTSATTTAAKIFFQVVPGTTGKTYVGKAGMDKSTLAGVVRIMAAAPAGAISESFGIETGDASDSIHLNEYVLDADVAGEGLLITYWQA